MMLTSELRYSIPSDVRNRGVQYFQHGRVRIREGDAQHVLAVVRGGADYEVMLQVERFPESDDEYVKVACDCPYFETEYEPCKHVWAAMLAAEKNGYCRGTTRDGPSELFLWDEMDDGNVPESKPSAPVPPPPPKPLHWKQTFVSLVQQAASAPAASAPSQLHYFIDAAKSIARGQLCIDVVFERVKPGQLPQRSMQWVNSIAVNGLPPDDKVIANFFMRASGYYTSELKTQLDLLESDLALMLPRIVATGRCRVGDAKLFVGGDQHLERLPLVKWEPETVWSFALEVTRTPNGDYRLEAMLRSGAEKRPLREAWLTLGEVVLWKDCRLQRLQTGDLRDWLNQFRRFPELLVPAAEAEELLRSLHASPRMPDTMLPDELKLDDQVAQPKPVLRISTKDHPTRRDRNVLKSDLFFEYDGTGVSENASSAYVFDVPNRRRWQRDRAAEQTYSAKLDGFGMKLRTAPIDRYTSRQERLTFRDLPAKKLPQIVTQLSAEGWRVEADGKLYRQPGKIEVAVKSGVDWFDLEGHVDFEGRSVPFPQLLTSLRNKKKVVVLDDGTMGVLPEEWLKKYALLAGLGKSKGDALRFSKGQVGLLDALLAEQPEAAFDDAFRQARERFRSFAGVQPAEAPADFCGELRGYQKEGLGWLHFLRDFGFGGCLADDMGLGKTVQVLALLAERAANRPPETPRPSLVVVPKSLVHNWKDEAARFAPQLQVYAHHGSDRAKSIKQWSKYDLVLTTYGTLRRDAALFAKARFDYGILDESQTVKNARTDQAKAVRLLRTQHRLAMSGTPIENHLGELWSLFEFLNPGMLGSASVFGMVSSSGRGPASEAHALLSRALRPFLLRRTKAQVAKDLPEKTEQTVYCDLEPEQRKTYDELRDFYRASLAGKIAEMGWGKAKIVVLEALLRLRQAACHPGLIDRSRFAESSAKLDVLLPQIRETVNEGHKVLVFSQFTSFLGIVRKHLDGEDIPYEYLDGKTPDRAARVERFQNDPDCKLFLISLKAGGVGLNLTAADYVFLLDPWWNPAVEAQAIDRAHRIGQNKPVFAYRLIARNTVEEKVLELQKTKRDLADAIINADNSLIRSLGREDLELLLS
ncbi:MAG: DEAD/DEAH box helicase [Gemmataceae bacterium]|nr:DEAD/DEAH box helicase [Gemmataceae bacterium]